MRFSLGRIATIGYGALLLALVCWFVIDFPIFRVELVICFALYAGFLWRWPKLWLLAIPALLPVFDLAPWSGRFFFDEFDALVLLTACVLALRESKTESLMPLPGSARAALVLLAVSYVASTVIRLWPPVPVTSDSFANYASPYNSLRVAKGFVWALLLLHPLRHALTRSRDVKSLLAWGFLSGLTGVALITLYQRWLFTGVLTWVTTYRTTANFSSMHTGDGPIDVWLAMTMPFLGLMLLLRSWAKLLPLTIALSLLALYALLVTESRGPVIAVGAAYAVGLLALLATRTHQRRIAAVAIISIGGAAALIMTIGLPLLGQTSLGQRFFQTRQDATIRLNHWRDSLSLRDHSLSTQLFGMGLGSFPAIHQLRSTREPRATRYQFVSNGQVHFLTLWPSQSMFMTQSVELARHANYNFSATVRSGAPSALTVELCEKWLLYSSNCTWDSFTLHELNARWQTVARTIYTKDTGSGRYISGLFIERPTKLTFFVSSASSVDVGAVSLKDGSGRELIKNGDFAHGSDHWFWTVDQHLQWHVKNLAVGILFDQGWLGIAAVGFLLWATLARLVRDVGDGNPMSAVYLASLTGFLVSGMAVSTFDQPRLTLAFYLMCFASILTAGREQTQIRDIP